MVEKLNRWAIDKELLGATLMSFKKKLEGALRKSNRFMSFLYDAKNGKIPIDKHELEDALMSSSSPEACILIITQMIGDKIDEIVQRIESLEAR